ncbi:hypothetical protein ID866_11363 [Astraeus odoratus]|nr:hypothetical protein ID866_11363 [Astraeus odoratus]
MLEATNKSKEETLGIVENACLKIGGMEFKLQIHVVGDTPFDLLLGHPFFFTCQLCYLRSDVG